MASGAKVKLKENKDSQLSERIWKRVRYSVPFFRLGFYWSILPFGF